MTRPKFRCTPVSLPSGPLQTKGNMSSTPTFLAVPSAAWAAASPGPARAKEQQGGGADTHSEVQRGRERAKA